MALLIWHPIRRFCTPPKHPALPIRRPITHLRSSWGAASKNRPIPSLTASKANTHPRFVRSQNVTRSCCGALGWGFMNAAHARRGPWMRVPGLQPQVHHEYEQAPQPVSPKPPLRFRLRRKDAAHPTQSKDGSAFASPGQPVPGTRLRSAGIRAGRLAPADWSDTADGSRRANRFSYPHSPSA